MKNLQQIVKSQTKVEKSNSNEIKKKSKSYLAKKKNRTITVITEQSHRNHKIIRKSATNCDNKHKKKLNANLCSIDIPDKLDCLS